MKNKLFSLLGLLTILTIVLTFNSCDDNSCDTLANAEGLILSDTIKTFISNYENTNLIVFIDELGNEVEFNVSEIEDTEMEITFNGICEDNASMNQFFNATSQYIQLSLMNSNEIAEPIFISLSELPRPPSEIKENIIITLGERFSESIEFDDFLFEIVFDFDENPNVNATLLDSLELNNRTFYSVYEFESFVNNPKLEIKYTQKEGIIFIGDPTSGKEYVYERKE